MGALLLRRWKRSRDGRSWGGGSSSLKLRQDNPAHLGQRHLAFWNPNLYKTSLAGPRSFTLHGGQARDGLRKGTVVEPLVGLAGDGEEEGNFHSSLLGQEQL